LSPIKSPGKLPYLKLIQYINMGSFIIDLPNTVQEREREKREMERKRERTREKENDRKREKENDRKREKEEMRERERRERERELEQTVRKHTCTRSF
jgi:hypothetical protein